MAEAKADEVVGDLAVQDPVPTLGRRRHLGEQILKFEHLDVVVLNPGHEVEMVAAGLL